MKALIGAAILALSLTGCTGATGMATAPQDAGRRPGGVTEPTSPAASPTVDSSKTVTVDGKQYTCGQLIDAPNKVCGDDFQAAFNEWGDNIHAYTEYPGLGPLGNRASKVMRYEDVAAAGLGACIVATQATGTLDTDAHDRFIDWLLQYYPDQERVAFLPLWFAANRIICPGVAGDEGYRTHDWTVD